MLTLNAEQMQATAAARFERQLVEVIAGEKNEVRNELSTAEGLAQLRTQQRRANGYGLTAEGDVASYVITAWLLGPDFDERFAAMRELLRSAMPPAAKCDAMERITETVLGMLCGGPA